MQSRLVEAITAALERKQEGRLADGTERIDHVSHDQVMRGNFQSSIPAPRLEHAESGLVEAVIAALERERQGHLAGGTEQMERVFPDQMMRGEVQTTFARIGQAEVGSVGAVIPALEREQEGHFTGGTARIEHVFHDQVMGLMSFNHHALTRLHETLKDALDPNGILSAGRYGIWPKHLRRSHA